MGRATSARFSYATRGAKVPVPLAIGTSGWALFIHQPAGAFDLTGPEGVFRTSAADPNQAIDLFVTNGYISLDKKVDGRSGVFWHTVSGYMAPKDHLLLHAPKTEFEGVELAVQPFAANLLLAEVKRQILGQPLRERRH